MTRWILIFIFLAAPLCSGAATQDRSSVNSARESERKLIEAAKSGDYVALSSLLNQGAPPNVKEEDSQRTPLFYAVQRGDVKAVRLLLDRGAAPNNKDVGGMTPLMVAARLHDTLRAEMVRILVDAKADVDAQSPYGDTAIRLAAESGFTDTVLFLAERGTRGTVQPGLNLALLKAAQKGAISDVADLLKHGANPNAQPLALKPSGEIAYKGDTPLIEATSGGHRNVVLTLLQSGADPNLAGRGGQTALITSAHQSADIAEILLERGASPNAKDDLGRTPLMHAVVSNRNEKQRTATMQLFIKAGADVNARDNSGSSVAQIVIASGNLEALPLLPDRGASLDRKEALKAAAEFASRNGFPYLLKPLLDGNDPDGKDKNGLTALMHVAQRGHAGMLKILLYLGSKPNLQDNNGTTALMHAARYRHTDAVKALLAGGADPNMKDNKGTTALALAIPTFWVALNPSTHGWANGKEGPTTAKVLLDGGADSNASDTDGLTPLILATGRGQAEITRLLLANGADLNAKGPYGISAYQVAAGEDVIEILKQARTANGQMWQLPKMSIQTMGYLLSGAALHDDIGLMEVLFREGADPNYGAAALSIAVRNGKLRAVQLLLSHKADPNLAARQNDSTPLMIAVDKDPRSKTSETDIQIARLLLDAGANVNATNWFGVSPLAKAAERGHIEMIRLLIDRGGNPNLRDQTNRNALLNHVDSNARGGIVEVVRILIIAGVDVKAKDNQGRTAADIAAAKGGSEIVTLLKGDN